MKFKLVTVAAAIAALSLAGADTAAAQPLGKPAQVTGSRMFAALPPASAFGPDFTRGSWGDTGSRLATTRPKYRIPNLSCPYFENEIFWGFLGDTAGAALGFENPNWRAGFPNSIIYGYEDVLQFANTATALRIYTQERAKYAACKTFNLTISGLPAAETTLSVSNTKVDGDRAFFVTELQVVQGYRPEYRVFTYVYSGTNVYSLQDVSGTNDEPSIKLLGTMIHKVQALYPRK